MTFISYAQNFEDVMLWRALKGIECGFYVDVGANDPDLHSVTKAFYEHGWRGINVEPVPHWAEKLQAKRKGDVNLQLAAAAQAGNLMLYELPHTGLSTSSLEIATRHAAAHSLVLVERMVRAETLTTICRRARVAPIHFLKIDVEGAEQNVLEGLDLTIIRPWIILVEATLPLTQDQSYALWEPILQKGDYRFAYFDGLNRFYVAGERSELLAAFDRPPNVFDEFVPAAQAEAERECQAAREQTEIVQRAVRDLERRLTAAEQVAAEFERRAHAAATAVKDAEDAVRDAEDAAKDAEDAVAAADRRAQEQSMRADSLEELAHRHAARALDAETQAQALTESRCWRYTAPVRWVVDGLLRRRRSAAHATAAGSNSAKTEAKASEALTPRARVIHAQLTAALARQQRARR